MEAQTATKEDIKTLVENRRIEKNTVFPAKPDPDPFPPSDIMTAIDNGEDGDAWLFTQIHREKFVYDKSAGKWYEWKGNYWQEDILDNSLAAIERLIEVYARESARQASISTKAAMDGDEKRSSKHANNVKKLNGRILKLRKLWRKNNVLTLASAGENSLAITGENWDTDPWLLGCKTGVIDLHDGSCQTGNPEYFIQAIAPTEWKGLQTTAPRWEKFLREIFNGNDELIDYIWRLLGYAITGLRREHFMPILFGDGRNGKTTLLETLSHVLGPLSGAIPSETLLSQRRDQLGGSATPDIMKLRGCRVAWTSETGKGRAFNIGKVKLLCGGDTLTGRPLFGRKLIQFEPTHTLFVLTNRKPKADPSDKAFWYRARLIPFELSFVDDPADENQRQCDNKLPEKLKNEASGILAWLVRGCLEWQERGLTPPDCVKVATDEYRKEEDSIAQFIDECCRYDKTDNTGTRAKQLHNEYKRWCEENGFRSAGLRTFGVELQNKGYDKDRDKKGMYYKGLRLIENDNE